ncbi:MAG: D-glycero-beta-D-manno-heptose 1-phosphate adenylyltransferase [Deltaproteobacteria bacterium]|nr:D-glycero-beta-D-manno-heptose 1-phosphate adenylyltransferase [Deltaproteobacteria bacterium]MBN2688740.1 D-glycero-beta-D-manno-heptose 1-phosphate adenylyltransferase [Deltaproteobacteria bacterium]
MKKLTNREKIRSHEQLRDDVQHHRKNGNTVVFTNGCFDIIHAGHAHYLNEAKKLGDVLIIALNSDESVRTIKGDLRPIVPQDERVYVMASLEAVDYVTVFNDDTPLHLIEYLMPDIIVKGGDWNEEDIVGGESVKRSGGRVVVIPYLEGISTTNIIDKIKKAYGGT